MYRIVIKVHPAVLDKSMDVKGHCSYKNVSRIGPQEKDWILDQTRSGFRFFHASVATVQI
jgi:hypothetical protein